MKTLKHIPPTPFKGGFFTSLLALCLSMGISQNANADLKDGLVAHWNFDDCTAKDVSGNGHDGIGNGLSCEKTLSGQGAKFTRTSESRVQLPYSSGMPTSGTIALQLKVDSAYQYRNYELSTTEQCALVFTTDVGGGDVTYPGSSWFHVCNNGDVSVTVSTTKYGSNPAQTLVAKSTKFRFGDLHTVSFSFGLGGQVISVDGEVVATNLQNTQELGAGGTHSFAIDTPTLGEAVPGFWQNNQWDGGFEGVVDSFRIYNRALTEAEVLELYNGKVEMTYTPEPDPTPIIGTMPDPKLEASGLEDEKLVPEVLNVEPWDAIKNKYTVFTLSGLNLTQDNIEFELDDCVAANRDEEKNFLFRDTTRKFRCMPTSTGEKRGRIYDTKTGKLLYSFDVKVTNPPEILGETVTISGQIKLGSQVAKGVFLSPSDDSVNGCATDNNGKFSCKVPKNWTGVLTPKLSNVRFSPALFSVNQPKKNLTVNFVGVTADVFPLNGVIPTDWKNSNWSIDTSNGSQEDKTAYEGRFSLKATPKGNKPVTVETTVNVPFYETVQIEFARRLTGGSLKFYVDGILKKEWSGQSDWVLERFPIFNVDSFLNLGTAMLPKTHTFKWEYTGNSSAWIDNVNYPSFLTQSGTTCENATAGTLKLMTISKPNCEQLESYLVWLKVIRPSKLKAANVFSQQIEGIASNNETAMNVIDWGSKAIGYVANPLIASKEGFAKNKLVGQVMADFFSYPCNNLESKAQEEACKTAVSQTIDLGITAEIEGTKGLGFPYAYFVEKGLVAGFNLYNAGMLNEPMKKLNNTNLADYFLDDYYKSGGKLETLRTLYKAKSTSMSDLVTALAKNKGYELGFIFSDHNSDEVISEIEEAKKLSSALKNLKIN